MNILPSQKQVEFVQDMSKYLGIPLPDLANRKAVVSFINKYKKEYYEKKDQDIRKKIIDEIEITDIAQEMGYTLVRKGHYYSLKEHDSIRISPEKKRFWRNSIPGERGSIGKGGSVIDFLVDLGNMDTCDAIVYLRNRVEGTSSKTPRKTEKEPVFKKGNLDLPKKGENMRRVYAYLIQTRKIAKEIVQHMVDAKHLYQDTHGNCVFVGYDKEGKADYGWIRGTVQGKKFSGDCEGCNYDYGFYIHNNSKKMIITESVIDGLSIMTAILKAGKSIQDYNFLFLCGTGKYAPVITHAKEDGIQEMIVFGNNDGPGRNLVTLILKSSEAADIECSILLPEEEGHDWNDELKLYGAEKVAEQIKFFL